MATTVFSGFTSGDYNSSNVGTNSFWLDTNSNSYTQSVSANTTTITSNFTLNHGGSGTEFSGGWYLRTYFKVSYTVNGVAASQYLYSDAVRNYTGTMTNGTQFSLGSGTVTIPHNSDGTCPDLTFSAYCSHWSSGLGAYPGVGGSAVTTPTYVPGPTSATAVVTTIPDIVNGKRYDGTNWVSTIPLTRFDGTNWVNVSTRKRFDGSIWVPLTN